MSGGPAGGATTTGTSAPLDHTYTCEGMWGGGIGCPAAGRADRTTSRTVSSRLRTASSAWQAQGAGRPESHYFAAPVGTRRGRTANEGKEEEFAGRAIGGIRIGGEGRTSERPGVREQVRSRSPAFRPPEKCINRP